MTNHTNMPNPFPTTSTTEENSSRTDQSNEQQHNLNQPSRQVNQTNQQNTTTTSTSNNGITPPQYSWDDNAAKVAAAVLGQIGFLVLAPFAQPNLPQQQNTRSETHPSPAPSTNQNLLQNNSNNNNSRNNNNNSNNMDANMYANLLSQVARLYQPNIQTTQQQHHSTSSTIPNHSVTTTTPNIGFASTNITDASNSSNKINNNTNIANTSIKNTTKNNTNDNSKVMFLEQDIQELSPYQCLVRKQIEVFQHPQTHSQFNGITQGRTRPIVPGQVGIRCRHCGTAKPHNRAKYAMLFPSRLIGVYQAAQNMANTHLLQTCKMIPKEIREELVQVRSRDKGKKTRKSSYGGGRQYWADCLRVLDVTETEDNRLRFATNHSSS